MPNSPVLWGPNSIANNLQSKIIQSTGELIVNNGLKNYINYNNFENQLTTGWSLGTTGALTNGIPTGTPTFGSGASGNLSISISTSSPISGLASLSMASSAATTAGNMLATDSLAIDIADQAKVLTYKFYYSVPSNPSNGNFSGTSSNSFGVACYDVTNSSWLPVAGNFAMTQNSGVGIATGTMQTNSTTANVRFVVYNANASAGAITVNFDSFYLGPQTTNIGPVVTDWQSYTPTGTWTINTTYTGMRRRVGDSAEYVVKISLSGAPNGVGLSLNLPDTIDTSKINSPAGYALAFESSGSSFKSTTAYAIKALYETSTSVAIGFINSGTTSSLGLVNNTAPVSWSSGDTLNIRFSVPIVGWSSNTVMSNDTDTRVVAMAAFKSTTQSISSSTDTTVTSFNTVAVDTHAAFNASTGVYTVPVSGNYKVDMTTHFTSNSTGYRVTQILKNGAVYQYGNVIPAVLGDGTATMASAIISCVAGDTIAQRVYQTSGGALDIRALSNATSIHINRLSGPSVIAASETVACEYNSSAGGAIANATDTFIDFGTKESDTHNAVVGAGNGNSTTYTNTWRFVAPVSGRYQVNALVSIGASGGNALNYSVAILKNGIGVQLGNTYYLLSAAVQSSNYAVTVNGTVKCNAGDAISVSAYQNNGASRTMVPNSVWNRVSIVKVGN